MRNTAEQSAYLKAKSSASALTSLKNAEGLVLYAEGKYIVISAGGGESIRVPQKEVARSIGAKALVDMLSTVTDRG